MEDQKPASATPPARGWLARSLASHGAALERLGSRLVIVEGEAARVLSDLARAFEVLEGTTERATVEDRPVLKGEASQFRRGHSPEV